MRKRIEVLHGVNLDMLGSRPAEHYGTFTLSELENAIEGFAHELDLEVKFFQTNHEGEYVERLHRAPEMADGLIVNPGAWTHYSYAIRDALEISSLPTAEVHISDLSKREAWRQVSLVSELCTVSIGGRGIEGYREALQVLKQTLDSAAGNEARA
ncbi:MAG: 3-dehydroquinate dehydratase [Actinobacteria bacterium]|nr:3-dehydroquinate dehydratase [Actinomycetota bacterium]